MKLFGKMRVDKKIKCRERIREKLPIFVNSVENSIENMA